MGASLCTVSNANNEVEKGDQSFDSASKIHSQRQSAVNFPGANDDAFLLTPGVNSTSLSQLPIVNLMIVGLDTKTRISITALANSHSTMPGGLVYHGKNYRIQDVENIDEFHRRNPNHDLKGIILCASADRMQEGEALVTKIVQHPGYRGLPLLILAAGADRVLADALARAHAQASSPTSPSGGSRVGGSRAGSIYGVDSTGGGNPGALIQREMIRGLGLHLVGRQWQLQVCARGGWFEPHDEEGEGHASACVGLGVDWLDFAIDQKHRAEQAAGREDEEEYSEEVVVLGGMQSQATLHPDGLLAGLKNQ